MIKKFYVLLFSLVLLSEAQATLSEAIEWFEAKKYPQAAAAFRKLYEGGSLVAINYLDHPEVKKLVTVNLPQIPAGEQKRCQMYLESSLAYMSYREGTQVKKSLLRLMELGNEGHYRAFFLYAKAINSGSVAKKMVDELGKLRYEIHRDHFDNCFDAYAIVEYQKQFPNTCPEGFTQFVSLHQQYPGKDANIALTMGRAFQSQGKVVPAQRWLRVALENGCVEASYYLVSQIIGKTLETAPTLQSDNECFLSPTTKGAIMAKGSIYAEDDEDRIENELKKYLSAHKPELITLIIDQDRNPIKETAPRLADLTSNLRYWASKIPDVSTLDPTEVGKLFYAHSLGESAEVCHAYLLKSAAKGFFYAQYKCGNNFWSGYGCDRNWQKALEYFKMAADQGHLSSKYHIAMIKHENNTVESLKEARALFKELGLMGSVQCLSFYASMLERGQGGPKNYNEALLFFQQAADQGNTFAEERASNLLYYLDGCVDKPKAIEYCRKAANKGDTSAQFRYAVMLQDDLNGSRQDTYTYLKGAADQGHAEAQYWCARKLFIGDGVETNTAEGMKYLRKSLAQNYLEAIIFTHKILKSASPVEKKDDENASIEIDLDSQGLTSDEDDVTAPTMTDGLTTPIASTPSTSSTSTSSSSSADAPLVITDDSPEKQEIDKYMKERQDQLSDFKAKKLKSQNQKRFTLKVKKEDYETIESDPLVLQTNKIFVVKRPKTIEFLNALYNIGDRKFTSFTMVKAKKALRDLGYGISNPKGENSIEITCTLKKERVLRYTDEAAAADHVEKIKLHNVHGHKGNNLYLAMKNHLKRFTMITGRLPEFVVYKPDESSEKSVE